MLLSVFTPTNNTQYLLETYRSLAMQHYSDWEWLVGLNGGAKLPEDKSLQADKRVRVSMLAFGQPNIGALKYACCQQARGEVLVELDHDDVLWPGVLGEIAQQAKNGADFIFSDAASFDDDKQRPVWYSGQHGWETYTSKLYDRELVVTRSFPVTPRSLCEVYYAPDHVRCWRRSFYEKIGGHDVTLSVGDDHDLICRSYLAGGKFAHTGGVGYVYRFHPGNTVKARNRAIQEQTGKNRRKYIHKLIDEWRRREKLKYLDLENNVEWIDNVPRLGTVKDNEVGCIRAYGVLHWVPRDKVPAVMEEFYRVLAPGGWLCCRVDSTSGPGAFVPSARSFWNVLTFDYFCERELALELQPFRGRFQKLQCYEAYVNLARDKPLGRLSVYADLCAIKEQRQPGLVCI
jgi:SAM-dependent methyltransferase